MIVLRTGQLLRVGREHFGVTVAAEIVPLAVDELLYVVDTSNTCQARAMRLSDGVVFNIVSMFTGWDTDLAGHPLSQTYIEVPL